MTYTADLSDPAGERLQRAMAAIRRDVQRGRADLLQTIRNITSTHSDPWRARATECGTTGVSKTSDSLAVADAITPMPAPNNRNA